MSEEEIEGLKVEIEKLKGEQAELRAKIAGPEPFKPAPMERLDYTARASMSPATMRDLATAIPPDLARDLHNDLAKPNPVTGASPSQLPSDRGRVEIHRGSGWQEPNPLGVPSGVDLCDRLVDMQDALDRHDLARRLGTKKE